MSNSLVDDDHEVLDFFKHYRRLLIHEDDNLSSKDIFTECLTLAKYFAESKLNKIANVRYCAHYEINVASVSQLTAIGSSLSNLVYQNSWK